MSDRDFRLGECVVRAARCRIERNGKSWRVKPKSMQVLTCLAAADGRVVSRNELFDAVWPGQAVTDDVLTHSVVELRKAFGDSAKNPRVIETIPKKGLRLVPAVTPVTREGAGIPVVPRRTRTVFVAAAVAILGLVAAWWLLLSRDPATATDAPAAKSIAVLPFVDMSPDADQAYFADGLSEELINRLARIEGLLVTGRTSSFYFRGRDADVREIGTALSVSHVLEGSVRKSDDALRITAQLIDVENGFHLWSDTYDRPFEDIFSVQADIAEAVATALSIRLSVGQLGTVAGGTDNVEAFDEFMQGSAAHDEFTAESIPRAIRHLERATELDPDFGIAWAQLANVYRTAWLTIGDDDIDFWNEAADKAIAAARRVAPDSDYVLHTAAHIAVDRRDWAGARHLFDAWLALDPPGKPEGTAAWIDLFAKTGNVSHAIQSIERFRAGDPLHPDVAMYLGHLYLSAGRIEEALDELESGYEQNTYRTQISIEGVVAALASGDESTIRLWLERAIEYQQPGAKGVHDVMLELLGRRDQALAWLQDGFEEQSVPDYYVIVWSAYYGDGDLALRAMRRSPDLWAFWLPLTQPLRQTAEFRDIVHSIGLVDYWREFGWNDYCRPTSGADFACT